MMNAGPFGIVVGAAAPQVQVVRCKGRCYLRNGFHRAFGMCRRGVTHIPALFRESDDYVYLGIRGDGGTFGRALMESANPPTVGHFTQGRATLVNLRKTSRIVQVNWDDDATRCFVRCDIVRHSDG
jgi:hypothetical protein